MTIIAYYTTRRGGSAGRNLRSPDEAKAFLKRARSEVTIRDDNGVVVGGREHDPDDYAKWVWWLDAEAWDA